MNVYFSDNEVIELTFGIIGLVIGFMISYNMRLVYEIVIRWAVMWFLRKVGLNMYISIKKKYSIKDRRFVILPYPKIIL